MLQVSQDAADKFRKERDASREKFAALSIRLAESQAAVDELTEKVKERDNIRNSEDIYYRSKSEHGMHNSSILQQNRMERYNKRNSMTVKQTFGSLFNRNNSNHG